jgi:hypothetical protein
MDRVYTCVHLAKDGHGQQVLQLEDEHTTSDQLDFTIHTPMMLLTTQLFCNGVIVQTIVNKIRVVKYSRS